MDPRHGRSAHPAPAIRDAVGRAGSHRLREEDLQRLRRHGRRQQGSHPQRHRQRARSRRRPWRPARHTAQPGHPLARARRPDPCRGSRGVRAVTGRVGRARGHRLDPDRADGSMSRRRELGNLRRRDRPPVSRWTRLSGSTSASWQPSPRTPGAWRCCRTRPRMCSSRCTSSSSSTRVCWWARSSSSRPLPMTAVADGRYEFLMSAAPLPITGAVGSPVNPAGHQVESHDTARAFRIVGRVDCLWWNCDDRRVIARRNLPRARLPRRRRSGHTSASAGRGSVHQKRRGHPSATA